jgi:hypothetical protein
VAFEQSFSDGESVLRRTRFATTAMRVCAATRTTRTRGKPFVAPSASNAPYFSVE